MLNKEQLQLFNDYKKVNNKIQGKPMTLGEEQEYKKRVSKLQLQDNLCKKYF